MNEQLIAGYSHFASPVEVMDSIGSAPAISPTVTVSILVSASFASGFSVAWTVDAGC